MAFSAGRRPAGLSPAGARRFRVFTLAVAGLEEQIAHLDSLNIDTSQRPSDDKVRTVMITDPDGNHIAFAEAMDSKLAR